MTDYAKRLIEVDLPIKRISEHARREKSIRHGHISTLHIWWARRPLAACRAVICAALWPDPADENRPPSATRQPRSSRPLRAKQPPMKDCPSCSAESLGRWLALNKPEGRLDPTNPAHLNALRYALLDFIADISNWDNSTVREYLETARALTQAAHEAFWAANLARGRWWLTPSPEAARSRWKPCAWARSALLAIGAGVLGAVSVGDG